MQHWSKIYLLVPLILFLSLHTQAKSRMKVYDISQYGVKRNTGENIIFDY